MTAQHLTISADGGPTLPLDAVTETFAILGKRGKGKTSTAVVLAEELIRAGQPVIVLDTVGVWWGLRSSADGKGPGLAVTIFGGDHADVPLEDTAGRVIVEALMQLRVPAVLDLSRLSKAGMRRFAADFVEQLYRVNREPLHVIFDEADEFAPQRPQPEGRRLLGAMEDFVRRGRARGLGCTLVTQRPAVIHKDVLTQAEVLIALGMTGPRDVAAIDEWIRLNADDEQAREVKASLASLPTGTAWVWSPGWLELLERVRIRRRTTFDSSATPKVGERRIVPAAMAEVDIAKLGAQIAATVERAQETDPTRMRKRISDLEAALRTAKSAVPEPVAPEVVTVPALTESDLDRLAGLLAEADQVRARIEEAVAPLAQAVSAARGPGGAAAAVPPSRREPASRPKPPPRVREHDPDPNGAAEGLSKAERAILSVLATHDRPLTHVQLAMLSGYSSKSGGYKNALSKLRTAGLLIGGGTSMVISADGRDAIAGQYDALPAGQALVDYWLGKADKAQRAILEALLDVFPENLTHDELAAATNYSPTSGGFKNALSKLRTLELISGRGDGMHVSDTLGEAPGR
ncbi:ATP-binding protein [Pseudoclavibacter sp. VKM Ac-2888]|uniref:ATP-binding protein n=1 Tax=Pseudoclavibacter sp. VKM Ac-2888 TaxID=2783830 RepID=UPI00188A9BA9|nr:DUF87 domain-containing protein [Pseudoclavibacter sp. VKM Ac-2888]MBF4549404.1 ATP-binding protein [Pseudoclavibacter sp. VKM Ac-2888]